MKLFVDDNRECPKGWKVARTVTSAIKFLATGKVEEISLDHDIEQTQIGKIELETFMPVAHYIAAMPKKKRPKIRIHTGNSEAGYFMAHVMGVKGYKGLYFDQLDYTDA